MASTQELKLAGFDDNEINDYVSQESINLREAGFSDEEIGTHFGPQPVEKTVLKAPTPEVSAPQEDIPKQFNLEGLAQEEVAPQKDPRLVGIPEGASPPISTITGKPVPTAEDKFAGGRDVIKLAPYAFASATRGMVPEALETAIMQPITKGLTGHDYVSPITKAQQISAPQSKAAQEAIGGISQMVGQLFL